MVRVFIVVLLNNAKSSVGHVCRARYAVGIMNANFLFPTFVSES